MYCSDAEDFMFIGLSGMRRVCVDLYGFIFFRRVPLLLMRFAAAPICCPVFERAFESFKISLLPVRVELLPWVT